MDKMRQYRNQLSEYARDYVLENTGLKVLALFITAVLWLSVASRPVGQITVPNVPIEFRNVPDPRVMTVTNADNPYARIYMRGPRDVLDSVRASDLNVLADLSGIEPGVRVIPLRLERTRLPASIKEASVDPRNIRITVENVVEREVAVVPRFAGELPPGYEYTWSIQPPSVRIFGAQSQVKDIIMVTTETVSLEGRTQGFSQNVAIDIGSPNVNISDEIHRKVQLNVDIREAQKERTIENVLVTLNGGPSSARIVPRFINVKVYGAQSGVDRLTSDDIIATVDYPGSSDRWHEISPRVSLSRFQDKVQVRSISPEYIRVR